MEALVSVMMPCYNCAKTLPLALASLIAQSYENWECILVDDASTDRPIDIVQLANDKRIKYIRLDRNVGRGAARQIALDRAAGDYLCMLDADDWLYPSKIRRQLEVIESETRLTLVSTGMAIVNEQNELVGVRARATTASDAKILGPLNKLCLPPVAHAPSMIRMKAAKQVRYNPQFRWPGEDVDFLLKVLLDRYYCILPDVSYVYTEFSSLTLEKILHSLNYSRQMFAQYRYRYPIASRINAAKAATKSIIYRMLFAVGMRNSIIQKRSSPPTAEDKHNFSQAIRSVFPIQQRLFK